MDEPILWALALTALVAVAVALVVIGQLAQVRREVAAAATAQRSEQSETLRWLTDQLTGVLDRFHRQVGDLERSVSDGTARFGELNRAELEATRRLVDEQVRSLTKTVERQLSESRTTLDSGLQASGATFAELRGQLGEVRQMACRMTDLATDIDRLQRILAVPKLRGVLGERGLEEILASGLPPSAWSAQYRFADGRTVDAVVRLRGRVVPIDAKFPLEAFERLAAATDERSEAAARRQLERAARARIDEIATRYVRPDEGTLDFAFLYVPAEGVYHELVAGGTPGLLAYALERRVVPVSPALLTAYLSTVLLGLRGLEVEQRAQELVGRLGALDGELGTLLEELALVSRHLANASGRLQTAERHATGLRTHLDGLVEISGPPVGRGADAEPES